MRATRNLRIAAIHFLIAAIAMYFFSCVPIELSPRLGVTANSFYVFSKLKETWPELTRLMPDAPGHVMLVDSTYYLPTYEEVNKIIHWRKTWPLWISPLWVAETFDCDDYALQTLVEVHKAFLGKHPVAFGIVNVSGHQLNIMVCVEGILFYDAFADVTRSVTAEDKPYFIRI